MKTKEPCQSYYLPTGATRVQYLDEAICISDSANTHWKGMKPTILRLATAK